MVRKFSSAAARVMILFVASTAGLAACGGSQAPAESPEAAPATGTESSSDGQHTMPDGTKMEGESHGEHTMPDGTKMEGESHGEHTMPDGTKMKGESHGSGHAEEQK